MKTQLASSADSEQMRKLLITFLILVCLPKLHGQNLENQVIASQFGSFQVPSTSIPWVFAPASCQVSGGNKNFQAVTTGVPIKIVDSNPAHTEIATPSSVNATASSCTVNVTTTYTHSSFYLTSGTGGLQEALNYGVDAGGSANTIVLDTAWHAFVAPQSASTVISSVAGNTTIGLVDITTTPYTYYSWSGSAYTQTGGGGPTGNAGGELARTYPNPTFKYTKDLIADFGAVCDGAHAAADTTAFTTALSPTYSGYAIHVKGTCQINNTTSSGLSTSGWSGTLFGDSLLSSNVSCTTLANDCLTINSPSGLLVTNIAFSFGPTRTTRSYTTGRLLNINGGSNISVDHATFNNGNVVGLEVEQANHINLHDIYVSNFLANGIFAVNNIDLKATDISTYNNGDAGFESSFYDGESQTSCYQIELSNFVSNNDEAGVYFNGCQHMTLTNFSILNPLNIGVAVVQDATTTVTQVPDDVTVSNGSIVGAGLGQAGAADAYGIYGNIATNSLTAPSRVSISNVVVRNSTGPGIQFGDYNTFVLQFDGVNVDTTGTGTASEGIYVNGNEAHFSNTRVNKAGLRCLNIYATKNVTSTNFTCENPNQANTSTIAIWDQTSGNVTFNGINLIDTYATTGRSGITQANSAGNHTYNQINPSITGTWQGVSFTANTGGGNSTVYSTTLTPEQVSSSATPVFSLNTEVSVELLTSNVTSFTLPNGFNGQHKVLNWCQEGSGSYTVTPPANVRGFTTPTSTLYKCTSQPFTYYVLDAAWLATAGAGLNQ